MNGVRRQTSLLLDHGHPHACIYPVWMVSEEAEFVTARQNRESAYAATMQQMVLATMPSEIVKPSATKSMRKSFGDLIKKMTGD